MDTSPYTWTLPQGTLSIFTASEGYDLWLDTQSNRVHIEKENIGVEGEGLDCIDLASKSAEFFMGYFPIISQSKNIYSVVFYEMSVVTVETSSGINKGISCSALKTKVLVPFSSTAPAYRTVIPGLNLAGKCATKTCAANGDTVYVPIGMNQPGEKFQIPRLICERAICPMCQQKLPRDTVKNMGFWKCQYTVDGILEEEDEEYPDGMVKKTEVVEDRKFTTFKSGETKRWACLDITVESTTRAAMIQARSGSAHGKAPPQPSRSVCTLI